MEESALTERNTELLRRYSEGDPEAETRLIEENMGLVRAVARRFSERGCEWEDLLQVGTVGMLKAIRSFSLERGTAFSTYAVPLIVGEIRRHLRDEGPIKVSREIRKQGVSLMLEKNRILSEEGRDAGIEELAGRCGIPREEAAMSLEAVSPVTSLSETAYGEDSVTVGELIADPESLEESNRICNRVAIAQSIGKLPPIRRKIILLRYFRGMTQQATAAALGLTQVKVSREEKKILDFLKSELGG